MDFPLYFQILRGRVLGFIFLLVEGKARYAGLLLAPAEGFGLRPQSTLVSLDVTTEHLTPLHSWLESLICLHGECWRQDFWQRSSLRGKVEERRCPQ